MDKLSKTMTKAYFQKLDALEFEIRKRARQGFQGARRSAGKGSSVEFSDFKNYSPGDDIKRIDWHSYARFDKLFIKVFLEERQASLNIFIDTSQSMDFGAENKGYYAKVLALSLAYICLKNTDRVNLYACTDAIVARKEKISAKARLYELMDFLDGLDFGGLTDINRAVAASLACPAGASADTSVILSDFFSPEGYENGVKLLRQKGGDVSLVQILSREETAPAVNGRFRLTDSETGERMDVLIEPAMLRQYHSALSEMRRTIKNFCLKQNAAYIFADTQTDILEHLYGIIGRTNHNTAVSPV